MDTQVNGARPGADMPAQHPGGQATGGEPGGVELLQFVRTLCSSSSKAELRHRFIAGFGRLFDLPMGALYTVDPWTGRQQCVASWGVSDSFLARYERGGRELNWLQGNLDATGHAAYNMALM
ncbi:MAG: hypothetical protein ACRDVN_05620, partial [Jiangellaceae bacterium]